MAFKNETDFILSNMSLLISSLLESRNMESLCDRRKAEIIENPISNPVTFALSKPRLYKRLLFNLSAQKIIYGK
jgi:hypothetical protein